MPATVAAIGTPAEVLQHVRPLQAAREVLILEPDVAAQKLRAGDLAIFFSEHFERFRRCCSALKERQVATLYLVDGILEWRNAWENRADEPACPWTMRPVLSHKVACIGASQARTLAAWGNVDKIELTGLPRLDGFAAVEAAGPGAGPFRVLVATAKFPGFTPEQVATTLRSLQDLRQFEKSAPRVGGRPLELAWRVAAPLDKELGLGPGADGWKGGNLSALLASVDAVVTTPSTLMLEAMLAGRPVALLDYHNAPHYVPAAWRITTADQLLPVLSDLASPAPARMALQRELLQDALQTGESATARVQLLIDQMLAIAGDCVGQGRPLAFPTGILPPPAGNLPVVEHQRLFPGHGSFSANGELELQAELGHCRREIAHLEQVIAGLRGELGQAHEIFDQIQRHPIAGPVVRLRQRFLDFMARIRPRPGSPSSVSQPAEPMPAVPVETSSGSEPCTPR